MHRYWLIALEFIFLVTGCDHHTLYMEGYPVTNNHVAWRAVNYDSSTTYYDDTLWTELDYDNMSTTRKQLAALEVYFEIEEAGWDLYGELVVPVDWLPEPKYSVSTKSYNELVADSNFEQIPAGGYNPVSGALWDGWAWSLKPGSQARKLADSLSLVKLHSLRNLRQRLSITVDPSQLAIERSWEKRYLGIPDEETELLGVPIE